MSRGESKGRNKPLINAKFRNSLQTALSNDDSKEHFLKEYEIKLREIKAKYDNKLDYLRQKYTSMDVRTAI